MDNTKYSLNDITKEFTPTELALLELTDDGEDHPYDVYKYSISPVILTSKDAYSWAGIIALALESNPLLDESNIRDACKAIISKNRENLSNFYFPSQWSNPGAYPGHDLKYDMLTHLGLTPNAILDVYQNIDSAYDSLIDKELISDPIDAVIGGLGIAVLGVIPTGFTTKKEKGRVTYRKIEALFWSYEQEREKSGAETRSIHFKVWKIVKIFKSHFVDSMKEAFEELLGEKEKKSKKSNDTKEAG